MRGPRSLRESFYGLGKRVQEMSLVGRAGGRLLNPVMSRAVPPPILMTWTVDARSDALGYDHRNKR